MEINRLDVHIWVLAFIFQPKSFFAEQKAAQPTTKSKRSPSRRRRRHARVPQTVEKAAAEITAAPAQPAQTSSG